ncbi:MAG: hypothetical protein AAFX96_07510, partial [Pseudomonadota bacterium]
FAIGRLDELTPLVPQELRDIEEDESLENFLAIVKRNIGPAKPISIVDPTVDPSNVDFDNLYSEFLMSVDWRANPYLRSPEEMYSLGFKGKAYAGRTP